MGEWENGRMDDRESTLLVTQWLKIIYNYGI